MRRFCWEVFHTVFLAGAFALSRKDVSDTLPGVAIAVSLVPPLANVGILLAFGLPDLASGSLVLLLTNYFAILFTGIIVFWAMGFSEANPTISGAGRTRVKGLAIAFGCILLIALPLSFTSIAIFRNNHAKRVIYKQAKGWLAGSAYRVVGIDTEIGDGSARLIVKGAGPLPEATTLEGTLRDILAGRTLHVEIIEATSVVLGGN